jgi:hypothetical protein
VRNVEDMEAAGKDNVRLDEFSKRIRRCYEVKNVRNNDEFNQCMRIICYKLKV